MTWPHTLNVELGINLFFNSSVKIQINPRCSFLYALFTIIVTTCLPTDSCLLNGHLNLTLTLTFNVTLPYKHFQRPQNLDLTLYLIPSSLYPCPLPWSLYPPTPYPYPFYPLTIYLGCDFIDISLVLYLCLIVFANDDLTLLFYREPDPLGPRPPNLTPMPTNQLLQSGTMELELSQHCHQVSLLDCYPGGIEWSSYTLTCFLFMFYIFNVTKTMTSYSSKASQPNSSSSSKKT